ncbi:MAG: outer membrane beta-barrel protein [bacterium]|nr:outer membrane beta-barrel protein [bacterium]
MVFTKKIKYMLLIQIAPLLCHAQNSTNNSIVHSLYLGVQGGYGSTTWEGLVPNQKNQNLALSMSTPIETHEGGGVWGGIFGYELNQNFAIEGQYMHYPKANIFFDSGSLFSFNNNDQTQLTTNTETLSLMAKLMVRISNSKVRAYSSAGITDIHRKDMLTDQWHVGPAFSVGLNYEISDHFMAEIGGNYAAGFGESQLSPAESYIPFLYSGTFRLAYRL